MFDYSDYPRHSKIFHPVNKKLIGKIKDEIKGEIISEFAGISQRRSLNPAKHL